VRLLPSRETAAGHVRVISLRNHEALVIKGFHPSTYLRADYVEGRRMTEKEQKLRIDMFGFCFDIAFRALEGRSVQNKVLEVAWEQAIGKRFEPRQNGSEAALIQRDRVTQKLRQLADAYEASLQQTSDVGNDGLDDITSYLDQMHLNDAK
jgi:hypothetical protein